MIPTLSHPLALLLFLASAQALNIPDIHIDHDQTTGYGETPTTVPRARDDPRFRTPLDSRATHGQLYRDRMNEDEEAVDFDQGSARFPGYEHLLKRLSKTTSISGPTPTAPRYDPRAYPIHPTRVETPGPIDLLYLMKKRDDATAPSTAQDPLRRWKMEQQRAIDGIDSSSSRSSSDNDEEKGVDDDDDRLASAYFQRRWTERQKKLEEIKDEEEAYTSPSYLDRLRESEDRYPRQYIEEANPGDEEASESEDDAEDGKSELKKRYILEEVNDDEAVAPSTPEIKNLIRRNDDGHEGAQPIPRIGRGRNMPPRVPNGDITWRPKDARPAQKDETSKDEHIPKDRPSPSSRPFDHVRAHHERSPRGDHYHLTHHHHIRPLEVRAPHHFNKRGGRLPLEWHGSVPKEYSENVQPVTTEPLNPKASLAAEDAAPYKLPYPTTLKDLRDTPGKPRILDHGVVQIDSIGRPFDLGYGGIHISIVCARKEGGLFGLGGKPSQIDGRRWDCVSTAEWLKTHTEGRLRWDAEQGPCEEGWFRCAFHEIMGLLALFWHFVVLGLMLLVFVVFLRWLSLRPDFDDVRAARNREWRV